MSYDRCYSYIAIIDWTSLFGYHKETSQAIAAHTGITKKLIVIRLMPTPTLCPSTSVVTTDPAQDFLTSSSTPLSIPKAHGQHRLSTLWYLLIAMKAGHGWRLGDC